MVLESRLWSLAVFDGVCRADMRSWKMHFQCLESASTENGTLYVHDFFDGEGGGTSITATCEVYSLATSQMY